MTQRNCSLYLTFSLMHNLQKIAKMNKRKEKNYNVDLFKYASKYQYQNSKVITHIKRIHNDIENNYYTYDDYIVYYLNECIIRDEVVKLHTIFYRDIRTSLKKFSLKQIKDDQSLLISINNEIKLNGIDKYFKVNINGTSILYDLVKSKQISLVFYLRFYKQFMMANNKNIAIIKSKEFAHFENLLNVIFKHLKLVSHKDTLIHTY